MTCPSPSYELVSGQDRELAHERSTAALSRGRGVLVPSGAAWGGGALGSAGGRLRPQSSPALPPAAQAWSNQGHGMEFITAKGSPHPFFSLMASEKPSPDLTPSTLLLGAMWNTYWIWRLGSQPSLVFSVSSLPFEPPGYSSQKFLSYLKKTGSGQGWEFFPS